MTGKIRGKAFVVGDNIDTDQIIPAEYLSYNPADPAERKFFGLYAMSGLPHEYAPFVAEGQFKSVFAVIIAGRNFGCGSSREHAPLAIAEAGCKAMVAEGYARIFYRNSVNGGYLIPFETPQRLIEEIKTGDEVQLDIAAGILTNTTSGRKHQLSPLGDAAEILACGGIFEYARQVGMLK
ncbi:MAG: 3-isopropylmalate dehydratase [Planctomycetota bacterium]|nr:3-isopropylmalate dehydratase [Planctomycetota bacterium]